MSAVILTVANVFRHILFTRRMAETRPPPLFIADHLGLDFLNSRAVPVDAEVEWLASGEDLLGWLKHAGLVPDDVLESLRKSARRNEVDAIAMQARGLRDWFKPFVYKHMGRPLKASALRQLEPLNQLLARDEEFGQIVIHHRTNDREHGDGKGQGAISALAWRPQRRWHSPESLLLPIARSLADLVCAEDFTYVKACEGPACTLLFLDRTRGHVRRWCTMAICGNRAKQATFRERAQGVRRQ